MIGKEINMLRPGEILCDRYEIIETIGAGGMSIVYKARCHRLNRFVAIKVLKSEFCKDKEFVTKFKIEAQASARLVNPNIVNIYDVCDSDGLYFIVMEYVDGITLKDYIQKKVRLTMDEAIDFSIQIASGLKTAHENHIIHRDIKSQNIMVSKDGSIKVTDFGIAKMATSDTLKSAAFGSVYYISPEQARGGFVDEKSDIYSLGITMYEMVTGRVPFDGDTSVAIALMQIQEEITPPRQIFSDIYTSLEKIILKATQKKPERRYLTVNALIADLKRVQANPNIDIAIAQAANVKGHTREWTEDDLKAVRNGMNRDAGNSQLNAFEENTPFQNEMGELQPVGGISDMAMDRNNMQRSNQANRNMQPEEDYWNNEYDDEYDDYEDTRRSGIKKINDDYDNDEDDEYDDEMDPNLRTAVAIGGVVAAIVIAIVVILLAGKFAFGWFEGGDKKDTTTEPVATSSDSTTEENLKMVAVAGLTQEEALDLLREKGFTNYRIESITSQDVAAGVVIECNIAEGEEVPVGGLVILTISAGVKPVSVPNVVGQEDGKAVTLLEQEGFTVKHAYEYNDEVEKDYVISQTPDGGTDAAEGSIVTITVSNGKEQKPTTVPNLSNLSEADAKESLEQQGLVLGEVTKQNDDNVEKGLVISQSIARGTEVNEGDVVNIVISDGPSEKITTYTVDIAGTIQCTDLDLEGTAVVVRVMLDGEVLDSKNITIEVGTTYEVAATKAGLSNRDGISSVAILDAEGTNISDKFIISTSNSYHEVVENVQSAE